MADPDDGVFDGIDIYPSLATTDAMQDFYSGTALLRWLCRSIMAAIRPCLSNDEFDERFGLLQGFDS